MDLTKLVEYNIWADDKTRNLLRGLTEEEFNREVLPPYGNIRSLIVHIVLAIEINFVQRVDGETVNANDLWESLWRLPMGKLLDHWRKMDLRLMGFASTHMDLEAVFPNFLREGEIRVGHDDYLTQYLIHTVHHRAQIMSALRLMGKEAIGTDYLFYLSSLVS
ncbi:MAG: DinB family protein [Candidatus Bathyarchaeota archaeon]|nr:DinB family protein [Candidatus Bathyarchaeota archaeon]